MKKTSVSRACQKCGAIFDVPPSRIKRGHGRFCSRACSCMFNRTVHGETKTRLFRIWNGMRKRCDSVLNADYGGRGIAMCQDWYRSFQAFRDWSMANGYADDLEIDRRDVNGNYEPSNCRWATSQNNVQNRRRWSKRTGSAKGVYRVAVKGRGKPWIAKIGVDYKTLHLGSFATESEAVAAYNEAAVKHHGEFAHLN